MNRALIVRATTTGLLLAAVGATAVHPQQARADRVFVSNYGLGTVSELSPAGTATAYAAGLSYPTGMTFDGHGDLYVASSGGNQLGAANIYKIAPGGVVSTFASGYSQLSDVAFDRAGNLYACREGNGTIYKFTPAGAGSVFADVGSSDAEGITFDAAGNLYVASLNGPINKVTPAGVVSVFANPSPGSNNHNDIGLAFDAAGDLYDSTFSTLFKIAPNGTATPVANTGSYGYVAVDSAQDVFVTSIAVGQGVTEVSPAGVATPFSSQTSYGIAVEPVPEPAAIGGVAVAVLALGRRRPRHGRA